MLDPSPTSRKILEVILRREGHQVACFDDALEALRYLVHAGPADLLFLGLKLRSRSSTYSRPIGVGELPHCFPLEGSLGRRPSSQCRQPAIFRSPCFKAFLSPQGS